MADMQESKNKIIKSKPTTAFKDLIFLAAVIILVFILSYFFDAFIIIVKFLQKHPDKIAYIDEVITILLTLSIGLAVFSWRRWLELKKETAQRIKNQEELLKVISTQAETEKIINKQLRLDMDEMKHDVREILHFLLNKYRRTP